MQEVPVVSVVMCTWRRPEALIDTLAMLRAQRNVLPQLLIWNNNPDAAVQRRLAEIVAEHQQDLAVHIEQSTVNTGGFGRFFAARMLESDRVMFIDDDISFGPDTLAEMNAAHERRSLRSLWAWDIGESNDYWDRSRTPVGEEADYAATGALMAPTSLFHDPDLYRCPESWWFIEDMWLSAFARQVHGASLRGGDHVRHQFDVAGTDDVGQWKALLSKKTEMTQQLATEYGWRRLGGAEGAKAFREALPPLRLEIARELKRIDALPAPFAEVEMAATGTESDAAHASTSIPERHLSTLPGGTL